MTAPPTTAALELRDLRAGYGKVEVLHGIDMSIPEGATVAILGPNGAGKTTTLGAISGTVKISGGSLRLHQHVVTHMAPYERSRRGLVLIPEGRGIFPGLSVEDNLALAADSAVGVERSWKAKQRTKSLELFPRLGERLKQRAGTMSGGEQQMLAMSRAFLSNPKVLLMDEISMGLAPKIVSLLFDAVAELKAEGRTMVLVEQFLTYALRYADHCYLLTKGRVSFDGSAESLRDQESLAGYL